LVDRFRSGPFYSDSMKYVWHVVLLGVIAA
jgi:hypothetical protein